MSELFLVRHAQASFGTDDYDRLSPLGHRQSKWLGEYFRSRNIEFDQVICGAMVRHRETFEGIAYGMGLSAGHFHTFPQWNEFEFEGLVAAYLSTRPHEQPAEDAARNEWFLILRKALKAWSEDRLEGDLPESWADFERRIVEGLSKATGLQESGGKVLVVSSGGPISMAIRQILSAPASTMIKINLQTRNSSFSHFFFNQRTIELSGFNHVPHLDHPDRSDAVTYF